MSQNVKMFFQVILPRTLQLGKLEIPPKFVRKHGDMCLSNRSVLLVVPNGDTWLVCVEKREDGVVMFGAGWTEFTQHYSIGAAYIVMFRYNGHNKSSPVFDVLILKDSTSMEITYPRRVKGPFFERCWTAAAVKVNLRLPIGFVKEARLWRENTVFLQGQTDKKWRVKLNCHVSHKESKKDGDIKEYTQYFFGDGWSDFQKDNGLAVGDNLFFQQKIDDGCLISVTKVTS